MIQEKGNWSENLSALLSCFSGADTLEKTAEQLGKLLRKEIPLQSLVFVQLEGEEGTESVIQEIGVWDTGVTDTDFFLAAALEDPAVCTELLEEGNGVWRSGIQKRAGIGEEYEVRQFFSYVGQRLCGMLLLVVPQGSWREEYQQFAAYISSMAGLMFGYRSSVKNERCIGSLFHSILDGMKANLYVSDIETGRVLYMNNTMKQTFGIREPEGRVCWEALQKGFDGKCPCCVVDKLREEEEGRILSWEEKNLMTGRTYQNYDSLARWIDGRLVHLQQSVDITDLKSANTDELTQLLTRRPGKEAMRGTLQQAAEKGSTITVCMYDINGLKGVNDQYGHAEGDHLIVTVSRELCRILEKDEYAFRLSGDEFIVIFQGSQRKAGRRMEEVQRNLRNAPEAYDISFCFGLVEIRPNHRMTAEEILFLADERMYEKKRRFHILQNEQRHLQQETAAGTGEFDYNKELLYDALMQSTDDYIYICNMKTGVFRYTKAMVDEFGLPGEVIENAAAVWGAKVHENDRPAFLESNQEIADGRTAVHCVEYRAKNVKGEWVWVRCRGHLEFDANGEPELFAGFITNLGKKNKIDHQTGLFNKLEWEETVRWFMEEEQERCFGMMLLGIDDLKHINDLYNRAFGDEVIRITSQRLQTLLPSDASLYRLDGDEFGILVRGTELSEIRLEMEKIYYAVQHSFAAQQEYDGKKYYCTLSAGCVSYPGDAQNFQDLMKYAGYSLEYSKRHGKKQCSFYSGEMLYQRERLLEMVEQLRESIENDFEGFSLNFQPLMGARDGMLRGVEALSRWECRRFGKVSPVEFIPMLEQTGMIVPFGRWVLHQAFRTCRTFLRHQPELVLNVNISYLQVKEPDFLSFVKEEMEREQFPPENLVLELTESYFAGESQNVRKIFQTMRSQGIHVAMDDFGTGYSTLGLLKEAPADIVKIDKTFVKGIQNSNFDATFIRFVVELCHDVGIKVCLEGVETEEDYRMVSQMGLDMIQGFLFERPMKAEDLERKYLSGISKTSGQNPQSGINEPSGPDQLPGANEPSGPDQLPGSE